MAYIMRGKRFANASTLLMDPIAKNACHSIMMLPGDEQLPKTLTNANLAIVMDTQTSAISIEISII